MEFGYKQGYVDSPFAVPRPKDQPLEEPDKPTETEENLAISNSNPERNTEARNQFVKEACVAMKIPFSHFGKLGSNNEIDKPWTRKVYAMDISWKKLRRFKKLSQGTLDKVRKSLAGQEQHFDYWMFQASLKLQRISKEAKWLKSILKPKELFHDSSDVQRRSPTETNLVKLLQRFYGPIDEHSLSIRFLECYNTVRAELACKSNRKLDFLWEYGQKFGIDVGTRVINEKMQAEIEDLNILPEYPGFTLLDLAKDKPSVHDANPVTNLTHSEWFLLPRFRSQASPGTSQQVAKAGPSSLIIRQDTLKDSLLEFKKPPKVIVVDGYWPSLIDLTFTHPVRWRGDPVDNAVDRGMVIRDEHFWNSLHENMRKEISKYPLGIEANQFMEYVKYNHNYNPDDSLFPELGNVEAAKLLTDLFVTSKLPNSAALILFPAFLRGVLPGGDMPALGILKRTWKKMIFTVKIDMKRQIRSCDLLNIYKQYWKVNIRPKLWGFESLEEFVKWCVLQWGENGEEESLEIVGNRNNDPDLVYQPAGERRKVE